MDWLVQLDLPYEVRENFLTYLHNLYLADDQHLHFKRERLLQIHIPIVANGGQIPESLDFAQLVENLCSDIASVRIELMRYYSEFGLACRSQRAALQPQGQVLSAAEMATAQGLTPGQVRALARRNRIRGAIKQGLYWRFFQTA